MSAEDYVRFVPGTKEISIGRGVVYRPIRSWHSGVFAGERKLVSEHGDRSGCLIVVNGRELTSAPKTIIHRAYWNVRDPERQISAFLSYPNGMGCIDAYFWEAMLHDVERFESEEGCEDAILEAIGDKP